MSLSEMIKTNKRIAWTSYGLKIHAQDAMFHFDEIDTDIAKLLIFQMGLGSWMNSRESIKNKID